MGVVYEFQRFDIDLFLQEMQEEMAMAMGQTLIFG